MLREDDPNSAVSNEACSSGTHFRATCPSTANTPTTDTPVKVASRASSEQSLLSRQLQIVLVLGCFFASVSTMPLVATQRGARCYTFAHGTTIPGADYRRDYGLTKKECAETCKNDACCMAFEWLDDACTLKSRSLNGTVEAKKGATFGICIDYNDDERDRLWDHEMGGVVAGSKPEVGRDECASFCQGHKEAIAFSWRTYDQADVEALQGHCECVDVLHHVRVSFGSFAGFLD